MNLSFRKTVKYLGIFLFTGLLLWISFSAIEVGEGETKMGFIGRIWNSTNKIFITLSAVIALLSHYFRAKRWKLLLNPIGHPLKTSHSFMSVMIGYFVNLAIPRGGELSRCYNLYKLNSTPVNISFGTVICERIVDLFFLLALIAFVFLIQFETFLEFFTNLKWNQLVDGQRDNSLLLYILLSAIFIIPLALLYFFKVKKRLFLTIITEVKSFLTGIKSGIFSILKLERRGLFILYSFLIWFCYYLMNYLVMQAFPATAELSLSAALTIFVIGGIALTMPMPGGIGSYHLLVSAGLTLIYGITNDHAGAFSVIVHGWQTLVIIAFGTGSLILSQLHSKHRKNEYCRQNTLS